MKTLDEHNRDRKEEIKKLGLEPIKAKCRSSLP